MGISYHQLQKGPPPVTRAYKCYKRSDSKAMVHPGIIGAAYRGFQASKMHVSLGFLAWRGLEPEPRGNKDTKSCDV